MKILYNDTADTTERQSVKSLTLEEENEVISILNEALHFFDEKQVGKIQKLIYHYENLNHYKSYTGGLWATDQPEEVKDPKNMLFQLKF